ncbi:MAG: D-alanine--D-alanine ligase, partial [Acidobacteria bacterium]|nr:D-alanine--D-alanine ligase [Acidobacteriota bacterium]
MGEAITVGVVFGGRSVEHRVSVRSARTVVGALEQAGYRVHPLGIALDGCWVDRETSERAIAGAIDTVPAVGDPIPPSLCHLLDSSVDLTFPLVHGTWGEDGTMQGLFEMLDLPYVGAGVAASAIAMDKVQCKRVLEAVDVRTVESAVVSRGEWQAAPKACLTRVEAVGAPPLFVKPAVGGSSVGVRRVAAIAELAAAIEFAFRFDEGVLIERGVTGRELECAVLGYEELEASAVGEIVPGNEFYDYADKYLQEGARLELPAALDEVLADRIRSTAVRAFAAIGGVGLARVDFLLEDRGELYVNEINTLPGFTSISMYPKLWELSGVPLPKLVTRLVEIA